MPNNFFGNHYSGGNSKVFDITFLVKAVSHCLATLKHLKKIFFRVVSAHNLRLEYKKIKNELMNQTILLTTTT